MTNFLVFDDRRLYVNQAHIVSADVSEFPDTKIWRLELYLVDNRVRQVYFKSKEELDRGVSQIFGVAR